MASLAATCHKLCVSVSLTTSVSSNRRVGEGGGDCNSETLISAEERRGVGGEGGDCCVTHDAKQVYCQNGATQLHKHNRSLADGRTCFCVI